MKKSTHSNLFAYILSIKERGRGEDIFYIKLKNYAEFYVENHYASRSREKRP